MESCQSLHVAILDSTNLTNVFPPLIHITSYGSGIKKPTIGIERDMKKMNKTELTELIAGEMDKSKAEVKEFVDAYYKVVTDGLVHKDTIDIVGFGSLKYVDVDERERRNPRTGETMVCPAHGTVKFKPSKVLKEMLK